MTPQRARVVLRFYESGEWQDWAGEGLVIVDGPWVYVIPDEFGHWQTWPVHNVVCIDNWETPDAPLLSTSEAKPGALPLNQKPREAKDDV